MPSAIIIQSWKRISYYPIHLPLTLYAVEPTPFLKAKALSIGAYCSFNLPYVQSLNPSLTLYGHETKVTVKVTTS